MCVGQPGYRNGAGHVHYRAGGRRRASLQRGYTKGLVSVDLDGYANFGESLVPKAIMEGIRFNGDGTFINDFGTVNIGGTIILNIAGLGGTYTVAADCTGTLLVTDGPSFNFYVGPGAQQLWFNQTAGGVGTARD